MKKRDDNANLSCSFCGKSQREVTKLIAGPTVYICNECIGLCNTIIAEEDRWALRDTCPTARELNEGLGERLVGQAPARRLLAAAVANHLRGEASAAARPTNILMVGPPGCGKSLAMRAITELIGLPWSALDATRLREGSPFRGGDLTPLLYAGVGPHGEVDKRGIVCIEQVDRLAARGPYADANTRAQEVLLEILAGTQISVSNPVRAGAMRQSVLDTSEVLFIGAGCFEGLDTLVEERLGTDAPSETADGSALQDPTAIDLVNYGFLPEFVDRFGMIARFQALTGDELRAALRLERGPLRRFEAIFEQDGVSLTFSDDALDAITLEAQRRSGGGRALNAVLETVVREVSYEITREEGVHRSFQLDSEYVRRALA